MKLSVFDNNNISIFQFDKVNNYQGKKELDEAVEKMFNDPHLIQANNVDIPERNGKALCTLVDPGRYDLPKFLNLANNELGKWLYKKLAESAVDFGLDKKYDISKCNFNRNWSNKMFENSDGKAHRHGILGNEYPSLVGIYYYTAPENSAQLIFIDEKNPHKLLSSDYSTYLEKQRFHITPKPGMFIVHDPMIMHAVSRHKNPNPRICFVFEPNFLRKDNYETFTI